MDPTIIAFIGGFVIGGCCAILRFIIGELYELCYNGGVSDLSVYKDSWVIEQEWYKGE